MKFTKLVAVISAGAMMFSMSGVAFAHRNSRPSMPSMDITVTNGHTNVINVAASLANTGLNTQTGSWGAKETLYTGGVSTIDSTAVADINTTVLPSCNCSKGDITVKNSGTRVINAAATVVNTGLNRQVGSLGSNQTTGTGSVDTVSSGSQVSVNYTDFSVSTP